MYKPEISHDGEYQDEKQQGPRSLYSNSAPLALSVLFSAFLSLVHCLPPQDSDTKWQQAAYILRRHTNRVETILWL